MRVSWFIPWFKVQILYYVHLFSFRFFLINFKLLVLVELYNTIQIDRIVKFNLQTYSLKGNLLTSPGNYQLSFTPESDDKSTNEFLNKFTHSLNFKIIRINLTLYFNSNTLFVFILDHFAWYFNRNSYYFIAGAPVKFEIIRAPDRVGKPIQLGIPFELSLRFQDGFGNVTTSLPKDAKLGLTLV